MTAPDRLTPSETGSPVSHPPSRTPTPPRVPFWPALLDEATACAYLSVGGATLRQMCAKAGVRPVDAFGVRITRWRRSDLDAMIDKLPAQGAPSATEATQATLGAGDTDTALALIEARSRRRNRGGAP